MSKPDRGIRFREMLDSLTEEDKDLLVRFERAARLVVHVYELVGEADPKLVQGMAEIAKLVQERYERSE